MTLNHFLLGILVSFLGSLPIGLLNLTAVEIAIKRNMKQVYYFALSCALIEYFQAFFAIYFSGYLTDHPEVKYFIEIAVIPIFFILGIYYLFQNRLKKEKKQQEVEIIGFWRGAVLSLLNPMVIPFWFVWGMVMHAKELLVLEVYYIAVFVAGISFGSFSALVMFGYLGTKILTRVRMIEKWINEIIGIVLITFAIIQLVRVLFF